MRTLCNQSGSRVFALVALGLLASATLLPVVAEEAKSSAKSAGKLPPLWQRIDALAIGSPLAPSAVDCGDAEFIRRVSLDLTGMIPTVDDTRAFLKNDAADKRAVLIDSLLASPAFARHMAITFDVMLTDRRPEKVIKAGEFYEYLYKSFLDNKPYDQLISEIVRADAEEGPNKAAAKFYYDRGGEPDQLTRDIGRFVFGMDMQCAQCHDHPVVSSYLQDDYYGLYAFVNRTSLLVDAAKKTSVLNEKGEGEANYKSVFTGDARARVVPRLPKGERFADPVFAKGAEYVVPPSKTAKSVPKFSRRAKLGDVLATNPQFQRNIANRLWAMMMGVGIVHPVDFHHADNPPSHPELLALLSDEFQSSGHSVKDFLRQLALSRTYQRTTVAPDVRSLSVAQAEQVAGKNESLLKLRQGEFDRAKELYNKHTAELKAQYAKIGLTSVELAELGKAISGIQAEQKAIDQKVEAAKAVVAAIESKQKTLTEIQTQAQPLVASLKGDAELKSAMAVIAARIKSATAEIATAKKDLAAVEATKKPLVDQLAALQADLKKLADMQLSVSAMAALEATALRSEQEYSAARVALLQATNQLQLAKEVVEFLSEKSKRDEAANLKAYETLVDKWSARGDWLGLKPLSPEQFAMSLMQATGVAAQQKAAALAAVNKSPPAEWKSLDAAARDQAVARLAELRFMEGMRGSLTTFVNLYGGSDFQATVNQSLFFGNGSLVEAWLRPGAGTLTGRLAALNDPKEVADELYLSVYNRFPSDEERADVASFLGEASDKNKALQEMVWGLLSSNEFRFNH